MDSNEKEFNGIDNEEITEMPENEDMGTEVSQDEVVEDTEANEQENGSYEYTEETVDSDETAENDEFDSEEVQDNDGVTEGGDELSDANTLYGGEVEEQTEVKKKSSAPIIALIVVLAIIIAVLGYFAFGKKTNKYNDLGYVNVSGRTVQDIADGVGIELKEFLNEYGLPEDMPGDTTEINAIYNMPAKVYLQNMIGISFEDMKQAMNIPAETTPSKPKTFFGKIKGIFVKEKPQTIDENTPWYIIEGELTVDDYSGGSVDQFKEFYGLGDDVTGETKLKDIQDQINKKTSEMLAEQQAKENEQSAADNGENTEADQNGEAPEATTGDTENTENTEAQEPDAGSEAEAQNTAE